MPESYTPRHLAEKILAGRDALQGERKQVTVLFADVVGSTELIGGHDAEDAQQLLDGAVQVMMDAVHRYEGTVSRLQGDGLMALFGAPIAHEDHALRACFAALAMLDGVRAYADEVRQTSGALPSRARQAVPAPRPVRGGPHGAHAGRRDAPLNGDGTLAAGG